VTSGEFRWQAVSQAQIDWQDETPHSSKFDDVYYSLKSGLEESRYVYLRGNELPNAWQAKARHTILETGFGSGLNFLVTWQAWLADPNSCEYLHYVAIEQYPLTTPDLVRALSQWEELSPLCDQLLEQYPPPLPGQHRLSFEGGHVILDLHYDSASAALKQLLEDPNLHVDSFFLDGFTPSRNPEMWSDQLFQEMKLLSASPSRFATFTSASHVRQGLQAAGFTVSKSAGFAGKREMLIGHINSNSLQRQTSKLNWDLAPNPLSSPAPRAMILGAGLAGASTANALARRGWQVTVLDANSIASAASGNRQGVLYTRISHRHSSLNSFSIHSYSYALRLYKQLLNDGALIEGQDGELCGTLHLLSKESMNADYLATVESLPQIVEYLDSSAAAAISGLPDCPAGLFFPAAGWLQPAAVCRALLQHENIQIRENCDVLNPRHYDGNWHLHDPSDHVVQSAPILIVATGHDSNQWSETDWLPLQKIRGQVTHLPTSIALESLRTVICHDGYLPPAVDEIHCMGATFELDDDDPQVRTDSHQFNLHKLEQALQLNLPEPNWGSLNGRVGFRCASPDYLPMVGPIPIRERVLEDFAFLRKNAKQKSAMGTEFYPGLYLNTAHGSRGLTSTPLASELLASQINGEASPLERELVQALSPTRFLIRDLIRNRL
jgi:tRNA 5-methylaminomethyl-2-thiouridine biosynthesis bifunctional protein